jgi:hypothetical protein
MAYTSTVANYGLGEKTDADWGSKHLGAQCSFPDLDYSSTLTTLPTLSGAMLTAKLVKLTGATAVAPGSFVKYTTPGLTIASITGTGDEPAGVVDPYLTSSVAQNEYCWIIFNGPCDALAGEAAALNVPIKPDNTGRFVAGTEAANYGRMMEVASAAAEMKRVFLTCKG